MTADALLPFQLIPTIRPYVWGGHAFDRLAQRAGVEDVRLPVAEVWAVYAENRVADGALAGWTLREVCERYGGLFLGSAARVSRSFARFPLLIKLLDSADWLSVQVHPDDGLAERLEGPGSSGKSEVWHILQAAPGAELIAGLRAQGIEAGPQALAEAIRGGAAVLEVLERHSLRAGQTYALPAGTLHALGPGVLLYELQQASDITYRVYDWDRPRSAGRALHIEKSILAANPTARVAGREFAAGPLVESPHFQLSALRAAGESLRLEPGGRSFQCLTVTRGAAEVVGEGWQRRLEQYDTLVVPACCAPYHLQGDFDALLAELPQEGGN